MREGTQARTQGTNISTMENDLRQYFSQTRHHEVDQAYKDKAMHFIYEEFQRLGLETELQEFQEQKVSLEVTDGAFAHLSPSNSLTREEIASVLNDFSNRWCKREYV